MKQRKRSGAGRAWSALLAVLLAGCATAGPEAEAGPRPEARDTTAPAARRPQPEAPLVRLGVLVPQAGSLQPYATAILDGVRVAVAEHERGGRHRIEVLVRDASTAQQADQAVRELAAAGVVGIVGPLLEETVELAARARPDAGLVMISPTATQPSLLPNVFVLNVPDTLGAVVLGEYAGRLGGPAGVLHVQSPEGQAQARAFRTAYQRGAGRSALELPYASGMTTFAAPLRRLRDARVELLLLVGAEGDVRQILPQLQHYGLGGARVLGTGAWTTPDGLARVGLGALEGAVLAVPFVADDPAGGWRRFRDAYEQAHQRSLENAIPALGYDAATLILSGLPAGRVEGTAATRGITAGRTVPAATGQLVIGGGGIARAPLLVQVRDGELVPVSAPR